MTDATASTPVVIVEDEACVVTARLTENEGKRVLIARPAAIDDATWNSWLHEIKAAGFRADVRPSEEIRAIMAERDLMVRTEELPMRGSMLGVMAAAALGSMGTAFPGERRRSAPIVGPGQIAMQQDVQDRSDAHDRRLAHLPPAGDSRQVRRAQDRKIKSRLMKMDARAMKAGNR